MRKNIYYFEGFTLAEVLITLGIIGVVAAMTLPSLINRTQSKELETQYKKVCTELNQVAQLFKIDYCISVSDYTQTLGKAGGSKSALLLLKYLKVLNLLMILLTMTQMTRVT